MYNVANIGSRYLVEELSEGDEIWQLDIGALLYVTTELTTDFIRTHLQPRRLNTAIRKYK